MDIIKQFLGIGEDPEREAPGNLAVIICSLVLLTALFSKGVLTSYDSLILPNMHLIKVIISICGIFIFVFTIAFIVGWLIQVLRFYQNGIQDLIQESYARPFIATLNRFTCLLLLLVSVLLITGVDIHVSLLFNNPIHPVIVNISNAILVINMLSKIKEFIFRTVIH